MRKPTATPDANSPPGRPPVECSVLVPVLNEERRVVDSVTAMLNQRLEGNLEILLIDGGSTDRTGELLADLAQRDARVRILHNPAGATPISLNVGLRHARGRFVARMDAHTRYPPDYIALGIARLSQGDTRWVSGPQVAVGHDPFSRAVALALQTPLGRGGSGRWGSADREPGSEYALDSGVFTGVWERETLLRFGGWDERWLRNQDSELAGRFLSAGERLICLPAMAAEYTPRDSPRSLFRQYLEYGRYRARTARRHPDTLRRSHLLAPGVVVAAVSAAGPARWLRRPSRLGLGAYALALLGAGTRAARDAQPRREAALVPVALGAMHLGHGLGLLTAVRDDGAPWAALLRLAGLRRLADRLTPAHAQVYAPSLAGSSGEEAAKTASATRR